jgi:hypothetical protein
MDEPDYLSVAVAHSGTAQSSQDSAKTFLYQDWLVPICLNAATKTAIQRIQSLRLVPPGA